jgi:hypothetical protein
VTSGRFRAAAKRFQFYVIRSGSRASPAIVPTQRARSPVPEPVQASRALRPGADRIRPTGDLWTDRNTGEVQEKLHLHWRLTEPATGDDIKVLKEARRIAALWVGADMTNVSIVHPIRWPGSWHVKGEPRLARIVSGTDNEIDLREAVERLEPFRSEAPKADNATSNEPRHDDRQDKRPTSELIATLRLAASFTRRSLHCRLAGSAAA